MEFLNRVLRKLRAWLRPSGDPRVPANLVKDRLAAEPWFVDRLQADAGGAIHVEGWSFPQAGAAPTTFAFNGTPFTEIAYPLLRTDVGQLFWQRQGADACGFSCSGTADAPLYPDGVLTVSRSSDAPALERGRDRWFFPDPALHADVPDEGRRFRVIGNRDLGGFLNTGATDFHRLDAVSLALTGKHLWDVGPVLDWGVGCGRLARHWPAAHAANLSGCDIDHENVSWCAQHLAGRFVNSDLRPPLPFAADSFALTYGISIFTHLKAPLQFEWLDELRRITRPGGWVLTTVHGATAIDFFRLPPAEYVRLNEQVAQKGILMGSTNTQLDGHVDHQGEYVNVFHSRDYIQAQWSKYFDVVAIIPGYIFTHDLVVLRKR
jgi:SAM-dependent methyltransferase